ncbi:MAG TPA: L-serine ammonia-lyase, iron-sulfur-dependent subunit beta [Gemmatimonadota bacterium]|nr:L-serine ammonia-lyase, iron-sulfur-dependent subunit beta [Gemmatimonadota bacterium]
MSVFDIIGPRMVGPSSSHTAGALRLGLLARGVLGCTPERARVGLHGSFATTYRGHGTDRAVAAGLLGMAPDDPRIPGSLAVARQEGLDLSFEPADLGPDAHPASLAFDLEAAGEKATMIGASVGGGSVQVTEVNGREVELTGRYDTLIVMARDIPGTTAAITRLLAEDGVNIAFLEVSREKRGREATMLIQADHAIPDGVVEAIQAFDWVRYVRRLRKVTD